MRRPPGPDHGEGASPAAETPPPAPAGASADAEAALARHRQALQAQFPLPDLAALAAASAERARRRRRPGARTVVAGLLGAVMAALLWADPAYRTEHHANPIGAPQAIALADGSHVTLDSGAALEVRWHLRSRRATLQAGRALFAVSPARWRPFTVAAGTAEVRVTGTVFDVERLPGTVLVSLREGRVNVTVAPGARPVALAPGQRLRLDADGSVTTQPTATDTPAWASGQLVLEDVPLAQALADIQRYRTRPVRLAPGAPADLRVSGVFDVRQPDALLHLLPHVWPVQVRTAPDGTAWVEAATP